MNRDIYIGPTTSGSISINDPSVQKSEGVIGAMREFNPIQCEG